MKRSVIISSLLAVLVGGALEAQEAPARRSFVGKRLPDIAYVDTEGHTIRPVHYSGSVLVMITGIPW